MQAFTERGDAIIALAGENLRATEIDDLPPNFKMLPPVLLVWPLSGKGPAERYATDLDTLEIHGLSIRDVGGRYLVGSKRFGAKLGSKIHVWEKTPAAGYKLLRAGIEDNPDSGESSDTTASGDGRWVAAAHTDGAVAIWELPQREYRGTIRGLRGGVAGIEWAEAAGQQMLYIASGEGQLVRWQEGNLTDFDVPASVRRVREMRVSRGGETVMLRSGGGPLAVWREGAWSIVPAHSDAAVALSSDGRRYAIQNEERGVDIYNLKGERTAMLEPPQLALSAHKLRFANSDTRVVAEIGGFVLSDLVIWDVRGGKPLSTQGGNDDLPSTFERREGCELWASQIEGRTLLVDLCDGLQQSRH